MDGTERYSRQALLPEIGEEGQRKLAAARVLVVGLGGLGSPTALYLAGAGVGQLGLVDGDKVALSDLHLQILYATAEVGRAKAARARRRLLGLNPEVKVVGYGRRLNSRSARRLVAQYDVVVGAVDNAEGRYLLNEACVAEGRPLVEGGVSGFSGMVTVLWPHVGGPCYRCLFPDPPTTHATLGTSAQEAGIFGPLPGVIGTLQAAETLKLILGAGKLLVGRALLYDALAARVQEVPVQRRPGCPVCGGGEA